MTLAESLDGFTKKKFCVESLALDAQGNEVCHNSPEAAQWCTYGWFLKEGVSDDIKDEARSIASELGYCFISEANNALGYKYVETLRNWEKP